MHSYWFHIGAFPVRSYSTIFVLGFLLGFGITLFMARVRGRHGDVPHWWNLAPRVLIGGIVGARFWQVFFFDWSFYSAHPGQILLIWHGGLSIQGGIVGGALAAIIYLRKHKLDIWRFADQAIPGLFFGQSVGRDADFMNGSAYGAPTHQGFGVVFPPGTLAYEQYGAQPLWPAVMWEAQADIILLGLLFVLLQRKKGWPRGFQVAYYLITYSAMRFFMEMLRGDSPRFRWGLDAAQWTAAVEFVLGVALFIYIMVKHKDRETIVVEDGEAESK